MQGRVMALHQMAWYGSTPLGALAMGWIIQTTSPRVPFVLGAIAARICAAALVRANLQRSTIDHDDMSMRPPASTALNA